MMRTHQPTGTLTSLEAALAALLEGVGPVASRLVPLEEALGRVAAGTPPVASPLPPRDTAAIDGWACRALDLVGASGYSPVALPAAPAWVEAGDAMPQGCDCVLHVDLIDCDGPLSFAVGEAAPGQGVRRVGEDMAAHRPPVVEGEVIGAADLLVARKMGLSELAVRSPRVRVIDVAAANGETFSARFIAESVAASNATVTAIETVTRDAASVTAALAGEACDLLLLVGGTGDGRTDMTAHALAQGGVLVAHRVAIRAGETTAIGRLGSTPLVALAGLPDHVFAGFLAFVQPVLDRLSGRTRRVSLTLPLARKIASRVGLAEIVLLAREKDNWVPLAVGDLSLEAMRLADAWLAVPGDSEGYAAGTPVAATLLRSPN